MRDSETNEDTVTTGDKLHSTEPTHAKTLLPRQSSALTCSRACTNLGGQNIPRVYLDFSPIAGTGLFTDEAVEVGQEIGRYDGKIVNPEAHARDQGCRQEEHAGRQERIDD